MSVSYLMEAYRLKSPVRAVMLGSDDHGEMTILPAGEVVRVGGASQLQGFIEVVCDGRCVNVFREDLEEKGEKLLNDEMNS